VRSTTADRKNDQSRGRTANALPVAVIEIGTSSIRLAVAVIKPDRGFTILDSFQKAVTLGKDTFTRGYIEPETTEECVRVLRGFRRLLQEYGVADERNITAVASSAVREAANRDAFLDRILIATGLDVRVIDPAEVNRYTYLAVRPALVAAPFWKRADTLVVEVGGGSTETLLFRRGRAEAAHLYRLGSLRLRQELEQAGSGPRIYEVVQNHVDRTVAQIISSVAPLHSPRLVALGADARFAASRLTSMRNRQELTPLDVRALSKLTAAVLRLSPDELVRRYELPYPDAETLGPSLMVYTRLARALKLTRLLVSETTIRNGILAEIAAGGRWTEDYRRQIINSALALGRRYAVDSKHARYVARLCQRLFHVMKKEHGLDPRSELILTIAALLHESGAYVSRSAHHKHSLYLILNSDLFGLGSEDILLTALVARYHRRAHPQPTHEYYGQLDRPARIRVLKLAALLRVADALDSGHLQRLRELDMTLQDNRLIIQAANAGSLAVEQHRLQEKALLFEQIYGTRVVLRST